MHDHETKRLRSYPQKILSRSSKNFAVDACISISSASEIWFAGPHELLARDKHSMRPMLHDA